ncbi:MAG: GGDEF domain-containing protein [Aquificae bacterium]|nr:GGDEF domain-containing protein [Aquificota bacterium]
MQPKRSVVRRITVLLLLLMVLVVGSFFLSSYIISKSSAYTEVVNLSGKIRGEVQRYAKLYFAGEREKLPLLAEEIELYLERLKVEVEALRLPFWDFDKSLRPAEVENCWENLRKLTSLEPDPKLRRLILKISEDCWFKADEVTDLYQELAARNLKILEFAYYLLLFLILSLNLFLVYASHRGQIKKLEFRAYYDSLTGVLNRGAVLEIFQLFSKERYMYPMSVVLFDIDDFKKINDTYGHAVGDEVLRKVAEEVKRHLRRSDIFARWGGEEFLVLLPETDLEGAKAVAEKIRQTLKSLRIPSLKGREITASFGVTEIREGETLHEAIIRADRALYEAKRSGKDRVVVAEA